MLKLDSGKGLYPLWTTLFGLAAYLLSGFAVNLLNKSDDMLLMLLCLCGAASGLIMGLLIVDGKKAIVIAISSTVGLPTSLVTGFALGYILPSVAPFLGEMGNSIVSSVIMLLIFGTIMAPSLNGFRSIPFFILANTIIGIIFGVISIFTLLGEGYIPGVIAPFGIAIGLSTGLYSKMHTPKM